MPVSVNNNRDTVATSVSILKNNSTLDVDNQVAITSTILDTKADKNTTYTIAIANEILDTKVDDTEMVNYAVKIDTYTKSDIASKFTNIIAGAPDALNTLKEISDALGADANYSSTVLTELGKKAPKENPTLSGTISINTIDTIPDDDNAKPSRNALQNLKVGTGPAPKKLDRFG